MSTIKVDTIATRTGSGNITLSNNVASLTSAGAISGTNLSASGTLAVTGNTTVGGTLVNTGLITASAGVAIGGTGAANTLDDYEEGTWTPAYSSTSASFSYNTQYGNYIKVGGFVHLQFYLNATASGTTSNATTITGLPFAVANLSPYNQSGAAIWFSGSVDIRPLFNNSQTTINLWKKGAVATATAAEINNVYLVGSGSYRAS